MDILCRLQINLPPSGSVIYIPDVSYLRILRGKVIAYINKDLARRIQSEKFALRGTKGILVGYKGNRIYYCKLEGRPDIIRSSSIQFEEGSKESLVPNLLDKLYIPDYLDDSIDYTLSFETSKLLQATEHSTTDKAERSPENRYSAESDSNEGSVSNTIVVDHVLVPDSPIQAPIEANMLPPLLQQGRPITCSQAIPRIPSVPTTSTTSRVTPRITRSQSTATSASALLSVLI